MAVCSVSLPNEDFAKMVSHKLSPSKVFRFGLKLALGGGEISINNLRTENKSLKGQIKKYKISCSSMESKIANLKEELEFVRGELIKGNKK